MGEPTKKLTAKQQAFVREYLIDLNASAAALRAGYSKNRHMEIGWQLLQKTTVQAAIQLEMDSRSRRTKITADSVLKDIQSIKKDAMQSSDGEMLDRQAALKACELQGKHLRMFTEKIDLNLSGDVEFILTREGVK